MFCLCGGYGRAAYLSHTGRLGLCAPPTMSSSCLSSSRILSFSLSLLIFIVSITFSLLCRGFPAWGWYIQVQRYSFFLKRKKVLHFFYTSSFSSFTDFYWHVCHHLGRKNEPLYLHFAAKWPAFCRKMVCVLAQNGLCLPLFQWNFKAKELSSFNSFNSP